MRWKFWGKPAAAGAPEAPSKPVFSWPTSSYESVRLLTGMLVQQQVPPYAEWKASTAKVSPEVESLAKNSVMALVTALWFWKFATVHGQIAARMARDEMVAVLNEVHDGFGTFTEQLLAMVERTRTSYSEMPEDKRVFKVGENVVNVPFEYFCAMAFLTQVQDSPYYEKTEINGDDLALAECLEFGANEARPMWDSMVGALGPFNAADFPRWTWSERPGAHERHLQRRHGNPLFEPNRRTVNAAEVYYARVRDLQVLEDIRRDVAKVYETIKQGDLPIDWHPHLDGLREQLDELAERLEACGGEVDALLGAVRQLREHIIATWRAALGDNPSGLVSLDQAEALVTSRRAQWTRWAHQASGDFRSIPLEEVAPSLLCESLPDIGKSMQLLGTTEGAAEMRRTVLHLVMRALAEGQTVPQHVEKLAALGVSL